MDGTAALQVEVAEAEPLRMTGAAGAPRLWVAPPAPISVPRAPFVAGVIALVIVGVLGILLINTKTNENSFQIANLQDQNTKLDSQRQDLENQLVEVSSIGNLDAAARRLGLVKAENPALFRLPDGKVIGVMKPTTGNPAVTAQDAPSPAAEGTTDKGAANISPANGAAATGGQGTGTTGNGAAANGAAANGTVNGAANGGQVNGAATNGTTAGGGQVNGTAANGTAGTGTTGAGTTGAGTTGAGTTGAGTAGGAGTTGTTGGTSPVGSGQ